MNKVNLSQKIAKLMIEKLDKNQIEKELYHLLILLPQQDLNRQLDLLTKN